MRVSFPIFHHKLSYTAWLSRYLAIVAALTSEADYVFVPENPPPEDWQKRLCDKLEQVKFTGFFDSYNPRFIVPVLSVCL